MTPEERRETVRKSLRKRRAKLKKLGICTDCGLYPADPEPSVLCAKCKQARIDRQWRYK